MEGGRANDQPLIELPSVREGRSRAMLAQKESEIAEKDLAIESLKAEIDRLKNAEWEHILFNINGNRKISIYVLPFLLKSL